MGGPPEARVSLPPGIIKNRKPLIVPLSVELAAMLKKKFQTDGPVFDLKISGASGLRPVLKSD
jgi:hypothetical protein